MPRAIACASVLSGASMMLTMPTTFRAEPTTPVLDGDEAWRAVERRDPRFDGRFVYAVRSTRIYCRPSCPSRRPSRERVTFYAAPTAAEDAGYRACQRCHPREDRKSTRLNSSHSQISYAVFCLKKKNET